MDDNQIPVEQLPLEVLERRCKEESDKYRRGLQSKERFCLEIFRRALLRSRLHPSGGIMVEANSLAQDCLVRVYTEFFKVQIYRYPHTSSHIDDIDDLVQDAWMRFWKRAESPEELDLSSLPKILGYLQRIAVAAVIEYNRRERKHRRDKSMQEVKLSIVIKEIVDVKAEVFPQIVRKRFRQRCAEVLTNPLEYQLFSWYLWGLKPGEIAQLLSEANMLLPGNKAPTSKAVARALDRILARLANDPEIRDLLSGD